MQKALFITDETSLAALNDELAQDQFNVTKIASSPNGSWLVILDDSTYSDFDDVFDIDEEEQEELQKS